MHKKEIIIEIDESGNCSLEGKNFKGMECDKLLSEIERDLGTTTNRTKKREYNQRTIQRQVERN